MIDWQTIIKSFQDLLAQACLSALFVIVGVYAVSKVFGLSRSSLSKLWRKSRLGFIATLILSLTMALWANKTNGNYGIVELCNYGNEGMWNWLT